MITGYDNIIFSNKDPRHAMDKFTSSIKKRWPTFMDEEDWNSMLHNPNEKIDFFFCKDEKMSDFHDENGYSINASGEGCFYVIVIFIEQFNANVTIEKEIENSHGDFNRDPYDAIIAFNSIYEYTIVTPDDPSEDEFSSFLVSSLIESLK